MVYSIGRRIRILRLRQRYTQRHLAELMGVSAQAVSKWESGASDPSTTNFIALAKLFGIEAEDLLRETR